MSRGDWYDVDILFRVDGAADPDRATTLASVRVDDESSLQRLADFVRTARTMRKDGTVAEGISYDLRAEIVREVREDVPDEEIAGWVR